MLEEGGMPAPPSSSSTTTHLARPHRSRLIDPVGGLQPPEEAGDGEEVLGRRGRHPVRRRVHPFYLSRHERWTSPLFLVGESLRHHACGLALRPPRRSWHRVNGIMLVSSVLNFQTKPVRAPATTRRIRFTAAYAATAWYHHKLAGGPAMQPLRKVLDAVERWARWSTRPRWPRATVSPAPSAQRWRNGSRVTPARQGLRRPERPSHRDQHFCKELLRDRKRRWPARQPVRGDDPTAAERARLPIRAWPPSRPPYTATFNDYVRRTLGYKSDLTYYILAEGSARRGTTARRIGYADVSESLGARSRRTRHEAVRGVSYYDLATPYFREEYTLSTLGWMEPEGSDQDVAV